MYELRFTFKPTCMEKYKENHDPLNSLIFIVCLAFLFIVNICFGQTCVKRSHFTDNSMKITRLEICEPIILHEINDTTKKIKLGIYSDSLTTGTKTILYVYFFNHDNNSTDFVLEIGFIGSHIEKVKGKLVNKDLVEYEFSGYQLELLKNNRFDYFAENCSDKYYIWISFKYNDTSYFKNFLNEKIISEEVIGEFIANNR